MPLESHHGGGCCGMAHWSGFDTHAVEGATRDLDTLIETRFGPMAGANNNRMAEVVLTENQSRTYAPILAARGFRIVGRFRNSNSGNVCIIYHKNTEWLPHDRASLPFEYPEDAIATSTNGNPTPVLITRPPPVYVVRDETREPVPEDMVLYHVPTGHGWNGSIGTLQRISGRNATVLWSNHTEGYHFGAVATCNYARLVRLVPLEGTPAPYPIDPALPIEFTNGAPAVVLGYSPTSIQARALGRLVGQDGRDLGQSYSYDRRDGRWIGDDREMRIRNVVAPPEIRVVEPAPPPEPTVVATLYYNVFRHTGRSECGWPSFAAAREHAPRAGSIDRRQIMSDGTEVWLGNMAGE